MEVQHCNHNIQLMTNYFTQIIYCKLTTDFSDRCMCSCGAQYAVLTEPKCLKGNQQNILGTSEKMRSGQKDV